MARNNAPLPTAQSAAGASSTVTDPYELALLNSISVTDQDFQGLATDRAKAVREYILQSGKVEAERLFLTEAKAGSMKTEGPRVYLQLQLTSHAFGMEIRKAHRFRAVRKWRHSFSLFPMGHKFTGLQDHPSPEPHLEKMFAAENPNRRRQRDVRPVRQPRGRPFAFAK